MGRFVTRPSHRLFVITYAALLGPPILVLLYLSLAQQPLRGDLTRLGGFAESEYGWNQPQERFDPPLVARGYDRPFDIVVLGDSFSVNPGGQSDPGAYWTNYLTQRTGLSVVVLSVFDMTPEELLRHPVFVQSPPQLVILELIERYLVRDLVLEADERVGRFHESCEAQPATHPPLRAFRPLPARPVEWRRDTSPEVDFDQAANYLWKAAARDVLGLELTRAVRLALTRSDLFSSRTADQLLVYDDEIRKEQFTTDHALERAHCKLVSIRNEVQRNGRTRFVFMPVPDKATAYSESLADPRMRDLSKLHQLTNRDRVNRVHLVGPFRQAIRAGAKDLYMPNDTHWNSTGHRIAAETVINALAAGH